MQYLQPNTTLQSGKYRIERVLGQGGFGITYLATHVSSNRQVAIKELFLNGVNERIGNIIHVSNSANDSLFEKQKEKFKKEAKRIMSLENEHIVKVYDLFEENNTVYYAMDYLEGESLASKMKREGHPLTESEVMDILPQLLDALSEIHKFQIWHLDIKPANIMLIDKTVVLIDFGASKQIAPSEMTSTALYFTPGYAPAEQTGMLFNQFGPWTDLYAVGATLFNLLTGKSPLEFDIEEVNDDDVPDNFEGLMQRLINRLMQPRRKDRLQNTNEVRQMYYTGIACIGVLTITKDVLNREIVRAKGEDVDFVKDLGATKEQIENIKNEINEMFGVSVEGYPMTYHSFVVAIIQQLGWEFDDGSEDSEEVTDEEIEECKNLLKEQKEILENREEKRISRDYSKKSEENMSIQEMMELVNSDNKKGVAILRELADSGNVNAQLLLSSIFLAGYGGSKTRSEAVHYLNLAASQGSTRALTDLGKCYLNGDGVEEDDYRAFELFKKAADRNDPSGQYLLGWCYLEGRGTTKNPHEALNMIKKAADLGNLDAKYALGILYYEGADVEQNRTEAIKYFRDAAEHGMAMAQYRLGIEYFEGDFVNQNREEAIKWFRKAAEQGIVEAQYNLGIEYLNGDYLQKNLDEAKKWFQKAADQGDEDAQNALQYINNNNENTILDRRDQETDSTSNRTVNSEPSNSGCMILILIIIVSSFVMSFAF